MNVYCGSAVRENDVHWHCWKNHLTEKLREGGWGCRWTIRLITNFVKLVNKKYGEINYFLIYTYFRRIEDTLI